MALPDTARVSGDVYRQLAFEDYGVVRQRSAGARVGAQKPGDAWWSIH